MLDIGLNIQKDLPLLDRILASWSRLLLFCKELSDFQVLLSKP
jgi:hypothetical protein